MSRAADVQRSVSVRSLIARIQRADLTVSAALGLAFDAGYLEADRDTDAMLSGVVDDDDPRHPRHPMHCGKPCCELGRDEL